MLLETVMKFVLIAANSIVMILGFALMVLGALIAWGGSFMYKILQPLLNTITTSGVYSSNGVDPVQITNYILSLLKYVGWPVFLMGVVIVALALCGTIGASCGLRLLLFIYIIVTYALTIALIGVCIAFYAADDQIDTFAKKYLMETLVKYTGTNATNVETVLWTLINYSIQCCGINNGSDFAAATLWSHNDSYKGTIYNLTYPYSCCKLNVNFLPNDETCLTAPSPQNSNYMTGCYSQLRTTIKGYSFIGLGVFVAVIVLQMTLMLFAACVCQSATKVVPI